MTRAQVDARDVLFATLDPTMRKVRLPSEREIILSDTVGFVSDLPTELVAAFRATLEEVLAADLILHVRDISHPDTEAQKEDVVTVLRGLGLQPDALTSLVEVWNKVDRLDEFGKARITDMAGRSAAVAAISALVGTGCDDLLNLIDRLLTTARELATYRLPHDRGDLVSWLYDKGDVVARADEPQATHITVRLSSADRRRFERDLDPSCFEVEEVDERARLRS